MSITPEGEDEIMKIAAFAPGVGRSEFIKGTNTDGQLMFGNAITWQLDASMI